MEIREFLEVLGRECELLADTAERAGTDAAVPVCPGWRVTDLLRHTGAVHRWAGRYVADGLLERQPMGAGPELSGPELVAWYREQSTGLLKILSEAPADRQCWTFLPTAPPSPLAFWARRQAHEATVHRMDAESALGREFTAVGPRFAEDGVDELLTGFHARPRSRVRTDGEPMLLRIRAADTGAVWSVHLSAEPPRTVRDDAGPADCEITGTAGWLYAALWNRLPLAGPQITGNPAAARLWQANSVI
ncbi:maleylpyruvate isomerase family mycothiol-dependent enzyme [Streptomyces bambusae]|uniref:maleylpyruvate isomerase family mycothiol-dependent enzyme n=1 Tax=Streptomyces bambusae TaxID=1550616 RepID=UPI001CFD851C|nr:maleylpyruvate isomerase family mycothiol-dependent enzyme [Streptomyces bambusae]MCB5166707.1 maleylpyruvate isomerase family mycothiol-dependent enzyme [Streptomyces bambusae]